MSLRNSLTFNLCLSALLAASALWGQGVSGSASVAGTVTDETGAVIPGASIVLT